MSTTDPELVRPPGICQSCSASIRWESTPAGRWMPLNAEPNPDGNVLLADGLAHVVPQPTLTEQPGDRFMPHWATCPDAHRWKRR